MLIVNLIKAIYQNTCKHISVTVERNLLSNIMCLYLLDLTLIHPNIQHKYNPYRAMMLAY